ncbi:aldehyde dehydrogenase family protein [Nitrospirillum sp. BR 11163]|uniref:aldehyde dehydrogenase family protein n=1 Tax=Nitrospirillum sp. BR 11163 TaxID=3104323 RepID=UPI002AFE2735|nr:aldehyde dehydrogenase family protein [Nitrospirillum sp. BR 11163]MEA1674673.1 aldehyde dehydrogenase family protein [Nitrospirillum sp. BR 11163]
MVNLEHEAMQTDWRGRAAALSWDGRPLIGGTRREGTGAMAVRSPVHGGLLYEAALCSADMVDQAVVDAHRACERGVWSDFSPRARGMILLRLAELIVENHEELALRDTLEMGKPIASALVDIRDLAPTLCRHYAEAADKIYGDVAGSDAASLAFSLREPRGVVAAIAPWNYPLPNAVIKVMPALAAGNCVVLKPSELTPGSALRLGELALEAGVPPGVLNVIPGDGVTTGAALARHPLVDMVTFTGSTQAGRAIMATASQSRIRPVILECGGKSPQIVFADAPASDLVAPRILGEAFANQGQLCVARSRLLVHASRKADLMAALEREVRQYAVGDPLEPTTTFGPLAGQRQCERVLGHIAGALRDGARMVAGGPVDRPCGVAPTILDDVSQAMAIVRDEVFGPVLTVQSFESTEEAVGLANGTSYGLAATVWTAHYPTAQTLVRRLKTGHITVNGTVEPYEGPGMSLAGEPRGDSGFGSETGLDSLRSYTAIKGVVLAGGPCRSADR